jgi:hypothetical protein
VRTTDQNASSLEPKSRQQSGKAYSKSTLNINAYKMDINKKNIQHLKEKLNMKMSALNALKLNNPSELKVR